MKKLLVLTLLVFWVACGGSSSNGGGNTPPTQVRLNVTTASSLVGQTAQFNANVPVDWSVTEKNGGSVTNNGLYTAPANVGVFHVVATSKENKTNSASAAIDVSASFLSLEQLAAPQTPYSLTPLFTTLKSDGTWKTKGVVDTNGNPLQVEAFDVVLSPDGTKAAFTAETPYPCPSDPSYTCYFWNIGIADVATQNITLLTNNSPTNLFDDEIPQFSPDGKTLIYKHIGEDIPERHAIRTMNIDGSNIKTIYAKADEGYWFPTFSTDGKMIAFERAGDITPTSWFDGIATMNADGSNLIQMTGYDVTADPCYGYDSMPTYTSDGKQIVFTRECWSDQGGVPSDALYTINVDGSHIAVLHGSGVPGTISCQARALTTDTVVFSSNVDTPGISNAFDMYSIGLDGSKLTRLTNNMLYDGFSAYWMNYTLTQAAMSRAMRGHSPLEQRLLHKQMLKEHKVLVQ